MSGSFDKTRSDADTPTKSFFDGRTKKETVRIKAGDFYTSDKDENISTVLGSCISACIRDPTIGYGGMNHFMLPAGPEVNSSIGEGALYGGYAMESLINELMKHGARRDRMEVKLFGGGSVIESSSNVGERNAQFARKYLHGEGMLVVSEDLGGDYGRTLLYSPITGKAMVKPLPKVYARTVGLQEQHYSTTIFTEPKTGSIDLF